MIDLLDALTEAINKARSEPETPSKDIADAMVQRLVGEMQTTAQRKKKAEELLTEAETFARSFGEAPESALIAAVCGIGHAQLAAAEDAEVFYAAASDRAVAREG